MSVCVFGSSDGSFSVGKRRCVSLQLQLGAKGVKITACCLSTPGASCTSTQHRLGGSRDLLAVFFRLFLYLYLSVVLPLSLLSHFLHKIFFLQKIFLNFVAKSKNKFVEFPR